MHKLHFTVLFTIFTLGMVLSAHAEEDNLYKFDAGFYELLYPQQSTGTSDTESEIREQYVLINIIDGYENQLQSILEEMNAQNIFVSTALDFVSADVPVNRIIELVDYDFIYKIGDEPELEPQGLSMSQAKAVVGASNVGYGSYPYTGDGVIVGVIDRGVDFSHPDLQGKKAGKVNCKNTQCVSSNSINDHGTALAVIIAGDSSNNSRDGIAPDSEIYNVEMNIIFGKSATSKERMSRALDNIATNDIDIAMTSLGARGVCNDYTSLSIVIDKALDYGISFSTPIGNENNHGFLLYSCGFNHITVGSVDSNGSHYYKSSQGPAKFSTPSGDTGRIKPEITAIGVDVNTATANTNSRYSEDRNKNTGTSYANAFVAGASALIKEKQPDYGSLEIKSALLLGADWKAKIPATANDYDNKRSGVYDKMNKYGFGVLNIQKSLDYTNDNEFPNIILDDDNNSRPTDKYRITANSNDQVKVLLSWFVHPRGTNISDASLPINSPYASFSSQYDNYDITIRYPDGTTKKSTSDIQNNEFIIFEAPETGDYIITVNIDSGAPFTAFGDRNHPYVIASSHPLDKYPFSTGTDSNGITFGSSINDNRSKITLEFSERLNHVFTKYDFTLSHGTIRSVTNYDDSKIRYLQVYGIPANTPVTITYTGGLLNLGNTNTNELQTGTSSVTTAPTDTTKPTITITSPVNGATINSDSVTVSGIASDSSGISQITITGGGVQKVLKDTSSFSYTFTGLSLGSHSFTVFAFDNNNNHISKSVTVTIAPTPQTAPTLSSISNVSVNEGQSKTITARATDANGDRISYSLSSSPSWVTINQNSGKITINAPDELSNSRYTVTVKASDNNGYDTESFRIYINEVNQAPTLSSIGNKSIKETSTLSFTISGTDSDLPKQSLRYSTSNTPTGASINSSTGVFTWTPTNSQAGTYTITFTVTDNGSPAKYDSQSVTITVINKPAPIPQTPPTLSAINDVTINEGQTKTFTVSASDRNGDRISYSLSSSPSWVTISGSTVTVSAPSELSRSSYSGTVRATDNDGYDSESFTINITEVNQAPILSSIGNKSIKETSTLSFTISGTDSDRPANNLRYSISNTPTGATINSSTGLFTWTPSTSQVGTHSVTFTVTDDGTPAKFDSQSVTFTITEIPDNNPPEITAPSDKTYEATDINTILSESQIGTASATDDVDSNPTITSDKPDSFPLGDTTITYTATDNSNNQSTDTQIITIIDTTLPTITAPSNITQDEGLTISLGEPIVHDIFPVTITNNSTGIFPVGTTIVRYLATDDNNNKAFSDQRIIINSVNLIDITPPIITPPTDRTYQADGINTILDDSQIGTVTATDNVDSDVTITSNKPDSFPLGDTIITYTATDDSNNFSTYAQVITIIDTTPPTITAPDDITQYEELTVSLGTPTASDIFPVTITNNSTGTFPVGTTIVRYLATDDNNNKAFSDQRVTILPDPTLKITRLDPADENTGKKNITFRVTFDGDVTGVDKSDFDTPDSQYAYVTGLTKHSESQYDVNVKANRDGIVSLEIKSTGHGITYTDSGDTFDTTNFTSQSYDVIIDKTPPTVTISPEYASVITSNTITITVHAEDPIGIKEIVIVPEIGELHYFYDTTDASYTFTGLAPGVRQFTIYIFDENYNATTIHTYFVVKLSSDVTPPEITAPADMTFEGTGVNTILSNSQIGTPIVSDDIDSIADITITNNSTGSFPVGDTILEWRATDSSNNYSIDTQIITLEYNVDATIDYDSSILSVTEGETFLIKFQYSKPLLETGWQCFSITDSDGNMVETFDDDLEYRSNNNLFSFDGVNYGGNKYIDKVFYSSCKYLVGDQLWMKVKALIDTDPDEGDETFYLNILEDEKSTVPEFRTKQIPLLVMNSDRTIPVLNSIGDVNINEGSTVTVTVSATDTNNDSITYYLDGSPPWVTILGDVITISVPDEVTDLLESAVVVASDKDGVSSPKFIIITINKVNQSPILDVIETQSVEGLSTISFTVTASDGDIPAQSLSYTITGNPEGAVVDGTTGVFTWTPTESQIGEHVITFIVTDDGSPILSDSQIVTFTITEISDTTPQKQTNFPITPADHNAPDHFHCEEFSSLHDYTNDVQVSGSFNCMTDIQDSTDPESMNSLFLYEPKSYNMESYIILSESECLPIVIDYPSANDHFVCVLPDNSDYFIKLADSNDMIKSPLTLYSNDPNGVGVDVFKFMQ